MASFDDAGVVTRGVAESAYRLREAPQDFDPLLDLIGDARFVLMR